MSSDGLEVDPAVLWAASRSVMQTADSSTPQLRSQDSVVRDCGAGWATHARVGFADFATRLEDNTAVLERALIGLASTTAAAAARYERSDADNAAGLTPEAGSTDETHLRL
ncbi:WXG100 family type VII secretion target [Gordonia sp. PKS22-38]|uniref:WXG100 family type VII secretion target n=1 Tax=Gordonia prachuapensis TaxID=3115651 RepID=A0ABU7MVM7_9ACTN|nr:WXG100 family type VII secretion target [Gordonia sp. PKS22-38]